MAEQVSIREKIVSGLYGALVTVIILFSVGLPAYVMIYNKPDVTIPEVKLEVSMPLTEVAKSVMPGVVHVRCPHWQGSGFVVGSHLIATARHVVEGVENFILTTNDGHKLHATRAISDKTHDVGFIYIDDLTCTNESCEKDGFRLGKHEVSLNELQLKSIKECEVGQNVFAVGSPYGKINFNNLTSGIISGLNRDWEGIDPYTSEPYGWAITWVTSVVGHPGNSGCPIFTMDGKVIGILVGGYSPVLICAMPSDLFMEDLDEIERYFILDKYEKEQPSPSFLDGGIYNCH